MDDVKKAELLVEENKKQKPFISIGVLDIPAGLIVHRKDGELYTVNGVNVKEFDEKEAKKASHVKTFEENNRRPSKTPKKKPRLNYKPPKPPAKLPEELTTPKTSTADGLGCEYTYMDVQKPEQFTGSISELRKRYEPKPFKLQRVGETIKIVENEDAIYEYYKTTLPHCSSDPLVIRMVPASAFPQYSKYVANCE